MKGCLHSRNMVIDMAIDLIWRKIGWSISSKYSCVVAWPQGSSCCHSSISMCSHLGGEKSQIFTVQCLLNEFMLTSSEVMVAPGGVKGVHFCSSVLSELTLPPRCRQKGQFVLVFFFSFFSFSISYINPPLLNHY